MEFVIENIQCQCAEAYIINALASLGVRDARVSEGVVILPSALDGDRLQQLRQLLRQGEIHMAVRP